MSIRRAASWGHPLQVSSPPRGALTTRAPLIVHPVPPSQPTEHLEALPSRSMAPELHPDLADLAPLIGVWRGEGHGDYPTIEGFEYAEEVTIADVGKPFLTYVQRTKRIGEHPDAGQPLHAEAGYFRPAGPGRVELVIAQPTGVVEIHEGTFSGGVMDLTPRSLSTTTTAKEITAVERRWRLDGEELSYELWLRAVGQPHQWHLSATLRRT